MSINENINSNRNPDTNILVNESNSENNDITKDNNTIINEDYYDIKHENFKNGLSKIKSHYNKKVIEY